jgi:hypothetical protein
MGFAENLGLLLQWDATRGKWGKNGWSDRCSCFFKGEKGLKKKKKKKRLKGWFGADSVKGRKWVERTKYRVKI